jgi:hypothetical protein
MYRDEKPQPQRNASIARIIAALVATAVILITGFLEVGTNTVLTHADGRETRTIQGDAITEAGGMIVDYACFQGMRCDLIARADVQGIFPRDGVSRPAAIIGGMLVPYVLASCCAFLSFRMLAGWTRIVIAGSLSVAGLAFLIPPAVLLYLNSSADSVSHWQDVPLAVMLAVVGSTSLAGGLWLFQRAYRGAEVEW